MLCILGPHGPTLSYQCKRKEHLSQAAAIHEGNLHLSLVPSYLLGLLIWRRHRRCLLLAQRQLHSIFSAHVLRVIVSFSLAPVLINLVFLHETDY